MPPNPRPEWSKRTLEEMRNGTVKRVVYWDPGADNKERAQQPAQKCPRSDGGEGGGGGGDQGDPGEVVVQGPGGVQTPPPQAGRVAPLPPGSQMKTISRRRGISNRSPSSQYMRARSVGPRCLPLPQQQQMRTPKQQQQRQQVTQQSYYVVRQWHLQLSMGQWKVQQRLLS